ncbi:MAG: T9SS type A sorting domain-containing protein [Bacteroidia bacterium]
MKTIKQHIKANILVLCMLVLVAAKQQAQVVINAGVININGGVLGTPSYLVLNSAGTTSVITTIGTTGGIMMESEYNVTKYQLGVSTTTISVPYYSMNSTGSFPGVQFPLAVTGISGAGGAGNLQFSSKHAPTFASGWDNALYMPSTVNNMNGYNPGFVADNSAKVIDRFWVIDALGYATTPAVTYAFGFIDAEANANGSNAITVNNLEAMAFDQGALTWGNYGPAGVNTAGVTTGTVSSVSVGAGLIGNVFRSWTLVDHLSPLPVDLLNFSGICYGNINANLIWSTAMETNSSYFTLEKRLDGQNFTWLANVNAVGNSTHTQNYSYIDVSDIGLTTYYRLSETDINGATKVFNTIVVNGCNENVNENINAYSGGGGTINLSVYSLSNQPIHVKVYDVTGRLIYADDLAAVQGDNKFSINPQVANGIYVLEAVTNLTSLVKRVPILDK